MQQILQIIRTPFLLLTASILFVIFISVQNYNYSYLVIISAFLAHISVNSFNEYFDFKSGLDFITTKTPFSGGSGVLPQNPHLTKHALNIAIISLIIVIIIGIFLSTIYGYKLFIIGLIGVFLVIFYTNWLNKSIFLSLISAGLGFALLTLGSGFVLDGFISQKILLISIIIFFLVNNLLLLNQFPDKIADEKIGRKNVVIKYGEKAKNYYLLFTIINIFIIFLGVYYQKFPAISLITILPLILCFYIYKKEIDNKTLGLNIIITNIVPVILGISIWIS